MVRPVAFTHYEEEGLFLEGTGSMVLDRVNTIVYACESPRTSRTVLEITNEEQRVVLRSDNRASKADNTGGDSGICFDFMRQAG